MRVVCGDWSRVTGPSVTVHHGITAVFLDPPYADTADRDEGIYRCDDLAVAHAARRWAIENGGNPMLRIALCGYEGEHVLPPSWECVAWSAQGGYANRSEGQGKANRHRERIWFSPHCERPSEMLFGAT
ncbi:MAG: hypothetical protein IT435_16040 [Phycisphaerales bacterium]|nr:hypothetical protein [Phycisphaerales bacterium]